MKAETKREPIPTSFSSGLLLDCGIPTLTNRRLVLAQHAENNQWGIIAGRFLVSPGQRILETAGETINRELKEETDLDKSSLETFFFCGHIYLQVEKKLKLGFIYEAGMYNEAYTYNNKNLDRFNNGYIPSNSDEIILVKGFNIDEVTTLIANKECVYQPGFNIPLLKYWLFETICFKYEPWEGTEFAENIAESRTGLDRSCRNIFRNPIIFTEQ